MRSSSVMSASYGSKRPLLRAVGYDARQVRPMSSIPLASPAPPPRFAPEECPFQTVVADITHRCNMACRNCYIPNRTIPDMETPWLLEMMARLPRGTFIRFVGAEPTLHPDLPLMIREARRMRLHTVLVTNGL